MNPQHRETVRPARLSTAQRNPSDVEQLRRYDGPDVADAPAAIRPGNARSPQGGQAPTPPMAAATSADGRGASVMEVTVPVVVTVAHEP
jgi:hypothetical protein